MQRLAAILGIVGGLWAVEEPAEAWAASAESEAAYAQAVERFEDGDVARGVEALLQSLDLDPANVQARLLLGELRLRQGDLGAAETALTQVLAVEELDASVAIDAATLRAEALLQAGRYDAALQALPDSVDARRLALRGAIEFAQDRLALARQSFLAAIDLEPGDPRAQFGLARVAYAEGEVIEAVDGLDRLLEQDADFAPAWAMKGMIALGRAAEGGVAALSFFDEAIDRSPQDVGLLSLRALALFAVDRPEQARDDVLRVVEIAPSSPMADYLTAAQAYALGYNDVAGEDMGRLRRTHPDYQPALLLEAFVVQRLGQRDRAAEILQAQLERRPNDVTVRRALAALLLAAERPVEAADVIGSLAPGDQKPQDRRLLASALVRSNAYEAAGRLFQSMRREAGPSLGRGGGRVGGAALTALGAPLDLTSRRPARPVEPDFAHSVLGVLDRLGRRDLVEAREMLEALIAEAPQDPVLFELMGELELAEDRPDAARASFEKALSIDPEFVAAHDNLDALDRSENTPESIITRLETLLRANPTSEWLALRSAQAYLAAERPDDAVELLKGRFAEAAGEALIGRAYIRMLLQADRREDAVRAIKRLSVNSDQNLDTLVFGVNALIAAGAGADAVAAARRVTALLPEDSRGFLLVARAQLAQNDVDAARKTLERSVAADPRSIDLSGALMELEASVGAIDAALAVGEKLARHHPRASTRLRASVLRAAGRNDEAETLLASAMETTPTGAIALDLFALRIAASRDAEAFEAMDAWLAENPEDAAALSAKGSALLSLGRLEEAALVLQAAIQRSPTPAALNNYAWTLAELQRPGALEFAERAYRAAPGDPRVAATFGRLLVAGGQALRGVRLLRLAAAKLPTDGDVLFYYAVALESSGDRDLAVETLRTALDVATDFGAREAAEALLAELR